MPWRDTQQVCLNGHQITNAYHNDPLSRKVHCTTCGAKTITSCPNCKNDIPGKIHYERIIDLLGDSTSVPQICQHCGKKFPWADKINKIKTNNNQVHKGPTRIKFRNLLKIVGIALTTTSVLLAIITDFFQAWDIFKPKIERRFQPIISIATTPIRINYYDNPHSKKEFSLNNKVETGNGVYKFMDSIKIDSFKIIDSSYFIFDINTPSMEIIKTRFDKMILGETLKEQTIRINVKGNYILKGDKLIELYELKDDKLIGSILLSIPYFFDDRKFTYKLEVPMFAYYK